MLNSPFMQTGANRLATKALLKGSKFSFNGIVTNLEKTVSTINLVFPLYNLVKPLISNSKTIFNAFKSTRNKIDKKNIKQSIKNNQNIINVEVTETDFIKEKKEASNTYNVFVSTDTPNKPFFN